MKKVFAWILTLALMLSMLPVSVFATSSTSADVSDKASISIAATDPDANGGIKVTVTLTPKSDVYVTGYSIALGYNSELVTPDMDAEGAYSKTKLGSTTYYGTSFGGMEPTANFTTNVFTDSGRSIFLATDANPGGFNGTVVPVSVTFYFEQTEAAKQSGGVAEFELLTGNASGTTLFEVTVYGEDLGISTLSTPVKTSLSFPIKSVALTGSVTTPSKGGTDSSSITAGTGYTGTVTWSPELSGGKFAANTAYTATVTLTPKTGYVFADGMTVTGLGGYTFTKSGSNYVASKTFTATETKALSALVVTTAPTKTTYTHGDTFDKTGMVVKATYDDASVDTDFTGYDVAYATDGQTYLKKDDTKVVLKSGTVTVDVTGLTVGAKQLTVTGLTAANRTYDGTTAVTLTGGELTGIVDGEKVTATMPTNGTIADANAENGKAVTFTAIALSGDDAGNYTLLQPTVTVNIGKAPLKATYAGETITYGETPALTVNAEGFVNSETAGTAADYVAPTLDKNNKDVGRYVLLPSGGSAKNYEFLSYNSGILKIESKNVTAPTFDGVPASVEYTGSAIEPTFTLKDSSTTISADEYTVAYSNNTNVGTATITVTDKEGGNYSVSGTKTFEITAHSVNGKTAYVTSTATQNVVTGIGTFTEPTFKDTRETANATIPGTVTYSYGSVVDGNAAAVAAVLKELAKGATGTITWTFTPSGGNYTGTLNGSIAFTMVDIEFKVGDVAATDANAFPNAKASPVYGDTWGTILGTQATLTAKVDTATDNTAANFAIKVDGNAYDASAVPTAGDHVVTVIYNGTVGGKTYTDVVAITKNVSVGKAALTVTAEAKTATYGDVAPDYTVTYSGFVNSETEAVLDGTLAFDCIYAKNSATGNYDITPKGLTSSNYAITFTKNTLTVNAKTLTADMVTVGGPLNYTAAEQTVPVTVADSEATITASDYDITGNKGTNVGDYEVTVTAKGNYTGTVKKSWKMDKAAQPTPLSFASGVADKTYGDAAFDVVVSGGNGEGAYNIVSSDTDVLTVAKKDDTTFTVTVVAAGTAKLTVSKAGDTNYADATPVDSANITVAPKTLTKPTAAGTTYTYTGEAQTFDINDFDETTMTVTGNVQTHANTTGYDVTVALKDKDNYKWSDGTADVVLKFVIAKANRNLSVTDPTGAITLYPTNLTKQIVAATDTDADNSAVITYTSDAPAAVTVNSTGLITAVANGSATVTVAIAATDNYNAATPVNIAVTAVAEPVNGIASVATDPAGGELTASIEGDKIVVSGTKAVDADVVVTLDLASGFTQSVEDGKLVVKNGEDVVATYTVDESNVVVKSADIEIKPETTAVDNDKKLDTSAMTGDEKTAADAAVSAVTTAPAVDQVNEAAAKILVDAAEAADATLTEEQKTTLNEYKLEVEVEVQITPIGISFDSALTGIKLDITPIYTITAVPTTGASILLSEETLTELPTAIKISVTLPSGFTPNYAIHTHNGVTERIAVTVSGSVATWYQKSFSEVELVADVRTATVNFTKEDGSVQQIVYTPADIGSALPTDSKSGYTFNGWSFTGVDGAQTTLTDELLTALSTASPVNATAQFTQIPTGGGGGGAVTKTDRVTIPTDLKNGTVSVDNPNAKAGETVTLTVKPDKGFTLETLTVTDSKGNEIALTNNEDGTYTFTMPVPAVTVHATFMEDNYLLNFFVDVNAQDYFYDAVNWAVQNGITNGIDDLHFDPNADCTRAQVVTFLWRAAGCPEVETTETFSDVVKGNYYEKAVAWAVAEGITNGTSDTTFSPDATCTRGQIVTFLARFAEGKTASATNPFADVKDGQFYTDAVLWAVEAGVTTGTSDTTFSPDVTCTRAQVVTFLYRYMGE